MREIMKYIIQAGLSEVHIAIVPWLLCIVRRRRKNAIWCYTGLQHVWGTSVWASRSQFLHLLLGLKTFCVAYCWRRAGAAFSSLHIARAAWFWRTANLSWWRLARTDYFRSRCLLVEDYREPLSSFFEMQWNEYNQLPLRDWLLSNELCDSQYKNRMRALGNIVVPKSGALALAMIARMRNSHPEAWS